MRWTTAVESVKEMVGMGLMSKNRQWVLKALSLNDEFGFYTEQEIDDILKIYWDWNMVKNSTSDRWEEFCKSYGEKSCSGPTVDEWHPSQVSDDFMTNLDGHISLPDHVWHRSESRAMSAWADELSDWIKSLEADVRRWCAQQPEIIDIEDPFIWGTCFHVNTDGCSVEIQISVAPKISLAKLIQLEKNNIHSHENETKGKKNE